MSYLLLCGDARRIPLRSESVHCVVTSPPYFGLRDYGTARWEGGDPTCDHRSPSMRDGRNESRPMLPGSSASNAPQLRLAANSPCGVCGAKRVDRQIGLEPTPDEFIDSMVGVFREVYRVLRADGTLWLNLGDSYCQDTKWGGSSSHKNETKVGYPRASERRNSGCKSKDLIGIPWRVALALRDDGWYLRSDIIWAKPNPMPASVTDRPTTAHEYLFLLAKNERYFYDVDAIREPVTSSGGASFGKQRHDAAGTGAQSRKLESAVDRNHPLGRNKRSVWQVPVNGFAGAHFATFPPRLIEPCIKAGCPAGGIVLDPFNGAATTGVVSLAHGRLYIGLDLNPEYLAMSTRRIERPHAPTPRPSEIVNSSQPTLFGD